MKNIYTKLCLIIFIFSGLLNNVFAQAPEGILFQAEARDEKGKIIAKEMLNVKIKIHQDDPTGFVVWDEEHAVTTDNNGLFTIVIGEGVSSYIFSDIDWAEHTHFLEVQVKDPKTLLWIVMGTSQLLSVPYALHAKTAENITGTVNYAETDPEFTSSQAVNITATDITNLANLSGTNTGDQDISGIAVNTQAIQDTAAQIRADIPVVTTYSVGDFAQGGIVFWLDETRQHGLVCAKEDQTQINRVKWYAGTFGVTQAKGDGPFAGELNTSIIIAAHVAIGDDGSIYAARICNELQITEGGKTYGDWYLPSKEELNLMHENIATINTTATANGGSAFVGGDYWSSTEYNVGMAWYQLFYHGGQWFNSKLMEARVRAVRAF